MLHLATYVGLADHSEATLADSFRAVAEGHAAVADVYHTCRTLAGLSDTHRELLAPVAERYGEDESDGVDEPERLHASGLAEVRSGEIGLLRDLQDLHVLADLVRTTWLVIAQGAQATTSCWTWPAGRWRARSGRRSGSTHGSRPPPRRRSSSRSRAEGGGPADPPHPSGGRRSAQGTASSSVAARLSSSGSPPRGATSCTPSGRPSAVQCRGSEIAGRPVTLASCV